ncbi:translation initiation factor IF-2 subunit gamma [Candidatus Pacearchaeota archaeon]|nr:translation initiation factor IF-2 subunit gamma [Candidatus Pacearchaeota archaeon]
MAEKQKSNSEKSENNPEKNIDIQSIPSINVGMFGHIDHGKTTLLSKLTGKWTDTHSEELKRGITIKLGYADCLIRKNKEGYNIKDGEIVRYASFLDAPGHEMLMATMLSGAAMIDIALLIVAANEGIKPQTKEHLMALQAKRIKNLIIIQNKIDLVEKAEAIKSYNEIKNFVKGTIAENSPIIPCSAQQEININKILEEISKVEVPKRDTESSPVFIIARSFDINRPGTKIENLKGGILGGALKKGKLKEGDEIEIKPGVLIKKENQNIYKTVKTKIVSIYKGNYKVKEAIPGGSIAIETELDTTLTKADSLAGCILGLNNSLPEIKDKIKIKFSLFKEVLGVQEKLSVENIKTAELLLLSVNTSITIGTVIKIKDNEAELNLRIPIVIFPGENIGIARNIQGHWRLVGFGEIVAETHNK